MMIPRTSNNSFTTLEIDEVLWEENEKWARMVLPAMVFIGILMAICIVGNTLVVYIYGFRLRNSTQNFLITCLACSDLLMGAIGMPADIADLRFNYVFESAFVCKSMKFCSFFTTNCSVLTLLTIAIDRHRRVTKPLTKQMSVIEAKRYVLFNISVAIVASSPILVFAGLRQRETKIPGLFGSECSSFNEKFYKTKYPVIYNAFFSTMFLIFSSIIGVRYFTIWKSVKTHRQFMQSKTTLLGSTLFKDIAINRTSFINDIPKEECISENFFENERLILKLKKMESDAPFIDSSTSSDLKPMSKSMFSEQSSSKTPDSKQCFNSKNDWIEHAKNVKNNNTLKHTEVNNSSSADIESTSAHRKQITMEPLQNISNPKRSYSFSKESQGCDQTTKVAFAVSAVFILSFVPTFTLMFIRAHNKNVYDNMHGTTLWMYNILVRFYLFNSALNPIVYGLLNEKFRLECERIGNGCVSRIY